MAGHLPVVALSDFKARLAETPDNESWRNMVTHQDTYWITEEAMGEGSPNLAVARGDGIETPTILYLQNPADHLHARAYPDSFTAGYRKAGGTVQLAFFEGEKYD